MYLGFALLIYGAYMWFRDVVIEAEHQGHHTPVVQIHHRYGMTLFIASEVMFFVAWFWAYFYSLDKYFSFIGVRNYCYLVSSCSFRR